MPEDAASPQTSQTDAEGPRRRDLFRSFATAYWPAVSSFVFLVVTALLAFILRLHTGDAVSTPPCNCEADSVRTREWQVWVAIVSAGLALAVVLAIHGFVQLARITKHWPNPERFEKKTIRLHTLAAIVWVLGLGAVVGWLVREHRDWPFDMDWRLIGVPALGLAAAVPWLALTWLSHEAVQQYRIPADTLRIDLQNPNVSTRTVTQTDSDLAALQQIWSQIVAIALALAVLVAVSLIPTGALRNLWLSKDVKGDTAEETKEIVKRLEESFTTTDVLLYGAMWALVAAVVVIPLVASWRASAQSVIDAAYPPNTTTAKSDAARAARASLESMLNLSSGILRNPLTVLTVATPLVTAALAAFVPEIGR